MKRKYLMTVMAAVALGGLFSSCSKEIESVEGNSVVQDIVTNYETAFITRFGQPAETQTWGFGPITTGTRAEVTNPSITEIGYTFNAQMAKASTALQVTPEYMNNYSSWKNTGWNDKFYLVNGTQVSSDELISQKLKEAIKKVIVGTQAEPGLIPEQQNNIQKAQSTGYSIVTQGGPVTLTPVYHQSSSGDMISYYYYKEGTTPDVTKLKKYTIGNMADPEECKTNPNALKQTTYSLVYEDEYGNVSYTFPKDYVINFIVSNTDRLHNGSQLEIFNPEALTYKDQFKVSAGTAYSIGETYYSDNRQIEVRFGNSPEVKKFKGPVEGTTFDSHNNDPNYSWYVSGNGVNGNINFGGGTCYYFRAEDASGTIYMGLDLNGGSSVKIEKLGNNDNSWNDTEGSDVSYTSPTGNPGEYNFHAEQGYYYAVYCEDASLHFYGYEFVKDNTNTTEKDGVFTAPIWDFSWGDNFKFGSVRIRFGKAPIFEAAKAATSGVSYINGYSAYTNGTGVNGGLNTDKATTYYMKSNESGLMAVAVALNPGKKLYIKDLNNNSGSLNGYDGIEMASKYYGIYLFSVVAGHEYAIYADGSKLAFYGCGLVSNNPTKLIDNNPEFYGDGNYNKAIHSSGINYQMWKVEPNTTPHAAVFNTQCTDENGKTVKLSLIGFEDWTDLDFNDVIFAVTGTVPDDPPMTIEVPDPDPEPICRIITEDLTVGENDDFDFNDVVFDVCPNKDGQTTTLIIRCIGGELPLYIGQSNDAPLDEKLEVHNICGIGSRSMTNTGWDNNGDINWEKECGRVVINGYYATRKAAWSIPITVVKKGKPIELQAKQREVPSKICVGTDYHWCRERVDVDETYYNASTNEKYFSMYVAGSWNEDDWEHGNAWYQQMNKSGQ